MAYRNLKEFVQRLKQENELVEITRPISPRLEMTEITDRVSKARGPALLFTHPQGFTMPVLINAFGSERRMALALGVDHVDDIAARIRALITQKPPGTWREKLATRDERLGYIRSAMRYWYNADWYGSEKRKQEA